MKWQIFSTASGAVLNGLCFGPLPYSSQEIWEELVGRFFVFFKFFGGAPPMVFSLCETVTFEPLLGLGRARGFLGSSELVGRFFPCSEWFVLRSSSLFLAGATLGAVEQMFWE